MRPAPNAGSAAWPACPVRRGSTPTLLATSPSLGRCRVAATTSSRQPRPHWRPARWTTSAPTRTCGGPWRSVSRCNEARRPGWPASTSVWPPRRRRCRQPTPSCWPSRGQLRNLAGLTSDAVTDLTTSIGLARRGAPFRQLPRAHLSLARALYLAGDWDESQLHSRTALSLMDDHRVWMGQLAEGSMVPVLAAAVSSSWPTSTPRRCARQPRRSGPPSSTASPGWRRRPSPAPAVTQPA